MSTQVQYLTLNKGVPSFLTHLKTKGPTRLNLAYTDINWNRLH